MRIYKKGFEVTITFIVTLILSVVILGSSLILVNMFFGEAGKIKASIDAQTESQIMSMLAGGAKVAVPVNRVEAKIGKLATFGVGILNVLRTGASNDFEIEAGNCTGGVAGARRSFPPIETTREQTVTVKSNEQKIFLVAYEIPDDVSGTYICNIYVKIKATNQDYAEPVYKAYIKII